MLHGFRASSVGTSLSHLLFVNDLVVFCSANEDEAKGIVNALDSNA